MLLPLRFASGLLALSLLGRPCAAIIWEPQPSFLSGMVADCSSDASQQILNAVKYANQMAQETLDIIDGTFMNGNIPPTRTGISSFYQWFLNDQDGKDIAKLRTFLQRILDTGPDAIRLPVHCGDAYALYLIANGWASRDFQLCEGNLHPAQVMRFIRVNGQFSSDVQPDGPHLFLCSSWVASPTVDSLPDKVLGDYVGDFTTDRSFDLLHEAFHVVSDDKLIGGRLSSSVSDPSYGWEGCTFLAEQGVQTNAKNYDKSSLRPIDNADSLTHFCQALSTLRNRIGFQWGRNGYAKDRDLDWIAINKPLDMWSGSLADAHRGQDNDIEMFPG